MLRQLRALWTLAWALFAKLLMMPFVHDKGAAPWLARLERESLTPNPENAWLHLERASRCIACGICDAVRLDHLSTSQLIVSAGREPADTPLLVERVPALRARAQDIARICPTRVGVDDVAAIIEDNARRLAQRDH